jgi:UDP-N-acetylglucosamine diphosphorylase/glucosamine-1-phosphate N-acetyltransferase
MSNATSKLKSAKAEQAAATAAPSRVPLILYDDAVARQFEPFALTRPLATLLSGTAAVWERWQTALQRPCGGVIAAKHLTEFDEAPGVVTGTLPAGTIVANSRFAPAMDVIAMRGFPSPPVRNHEHPDSRAGSWRSDGRIAAVRLSRAVPVANFANGTVTLESFVVGEQASAPIAGWWHDEVWDYIKHLAAAITDDIARILATPVVGDDIRESWPVPSHVTVIGEHPVIVQGPSPRPELAHIPPAVIEEHVVLDATAGPIMIESGVHVRSFTRITGPCRIGRNSTIVGGDVTGCSIGPVCKIRGEISSSIVLGYSNKGHEGFVGHSYLGRWVNLGAGTTTSNLKNTYGPVALWTPKGLRGTGMQFLGTLFGDHVKTGIGTLLTTGTVLGAAANVYGSHMPPKAVAPFAWGEGEPYDTYRLDKFLSSAETIMARRHMALSDRAKRQLAAAFDHRWAVGHVAKRTLVTRKTKGKARNKGKAR